jgi:2-polyprenyl-3-methyl-5-hydroxy-6-metoxy-1,4-benzoquinol methylase
VVGSIKAIDETRLYEVAQTFSVAANRAVRRFSNAIEYRTDDAEDHGSIGRAAAGAEGVVRSGFPAAVDGHPSEPDPRWERVLTRKLNVVFCDFCAQLISGGQPLSPLHWGFWPDGVQAPSAAADDFDPFWAFSENLLAHIPEAAIRILDVGCGLGANAKLLSQRNKLVTAVSPVAHHCESIAQAQLPGVEVRCARFEDMSPNEPYDLLLFSESVNHFPLGDNFLEHCKRFLAPSGFLLLADDFTEERARRIEQQQAFHVLDTVDISANVAPTGSWWMRQMRAFTAYRTALMSILDMQDPPVAARVRELLDTLDSSELKVLLAGGDAVPTSKGRYMIYLLKRD